MNLFWLAFATGLLNGLVLWAQETMMRANYVAQPVHYAAPYPTWY